MPHVRADGVRRLLNIVCRIPNRPCFFLFLLNSRNRRNLSSIEQDNAPPGRIPGGTLLSAIHAECQASLVPQAYVCLQRPRPLNDRTRSPVQIDPDSASVCARLGRSRRPHASISAPVRMRRQPEAAVQSSVRLLDLDAYLAIEPGPQVDQAALDPALLPAHVLDHAVLLDDPLGARGCALNDLDLPRIDDEDGGVTLRALHRRLLAWGEGRLHDPHAVVLQDADAPRLNFRPDQGFADGKGAAALARARRPLDFDQSLAERRAIDIDEALGAACRNVVHRALAASEGVRAVVLVVDAQLGAAG